MRTTESGRHINRKAFSLRHHVSMGFQRLGQILVDLHGAIVQACFAPEWRTLSLEKATQTAYGKVGG